jgi:DNA-binding Lrp family transcriptional regulator
MCSPNDLRLALLNPWQRGFPLEREPFAAIARAARLDEATVLAAYQAMARQGALSRIGGVFGVGAGGAGLLAAMAVPPQRLEAVAALVDAHPAVNHNYQREHEYNLWFVVNGPSPVAVHHAVEMLEDATGLRALRLPMQRAYRIDLGFDLRQRVATHSQAAPQAPAVPVHPDDRSLAALVEAGLPLVARPFDLWARQLGRSEDGVLATLQAWLQLGTLRRFGVVVRHHELGFGANAMTVFDVPDALVDCCGQALARLPGVTLAYRRARAPGWAYNLYCMVHGRDREAVHEVLDDAIPRCGLEDHPRAVLFSCRRFKQEGARRFQDAGGEARAPWPQEFSHAA